jgi:hypothetical protein
MTIMKTTLKSAAGFLLVLLISQPVHSQAVSGKSNIITLGSSGTPSGATVQTEQSLGVSTLPTYHALIIGTSQYQYAGPKLPNLDEPVKDAERLRQILTSRYSFLPENTVLLRNPTREDIINELDRMIRVVNEKDNLLIFYAGHGFYDKSSDFGFWLPSNAKGNSRADWIANSTIKDYVQAISTKHTLLITDACFGGSIFKTRAVEGVDHRKIHELYKSKSRKAMTSGNLTEVPDKSFFTNFLLKILDENEFEYLPASSLFTRLYEPVLNNSPTVPQFGVIQGAGDEGGDFIFILRKD